MKTLSNARLEKENYARNRQVYAGETIRSRSVRRLSPSSAVSVTGIVDKTRVASRVGTTGGYRVRTGKGSAARAVDHRAERIIRGTHGVSFAYATVARRTRQTAYHRTGLSVRRRARRAAATAERMPQRGPRRPKHRAAATTTFRVGEKTDGKRDGDGSRCLCSGIRIRPAGRTRDFGNRDGGTRRCVGRPAGRKSRTSSVIRDVYGRTDGRAAMITSCVRAVAYALRRPVMF